MPFPDKMRIKVLLWCDRHCCLCKKQCGTNIVIHHIVPEKQGGTNHIDNATPLCFDCHSEVERYNDEHPMGSKFKPAELKSRREQVYEEFTRHLVPPVDAQITQSIPGSEDQVRIFPDVGFLLTHHGTSLPFRVRVLVCVEVIHASQAIPIPTDHYSGKKLWNLNPRFMFSGHFKIPGNLMPSSGPLVLRSTLSIIDQYEREHPMLPVGFVYVKEGKYWYVEP